MSTVLCLLWKYAPFVYVLVTKTGLKEISLYFIIMLVARKRAAYTRLWCLLLVEGTKMKIWEQQIW